MQKATLLVCASTSHCPTRNCRVSNFQGLSPRREWIVYSPIMYMHRDERLIGISPPHFARRGARSDSQGTSRASAEFHDEIKTPLCPGDYRSGRAASGILCITEIRRSTFLARRAIAARHIESLLPGAPPRCVPPDLNHNGQVGSINLSQHAETVRAADRSRGLCICTRETHASTRSVHERCGRAKARGGSRTSRMADDVENVILVAEEEIHDVCSKRGMWVARSLGVIIGRKEAETTRHARAAWRVSTR